MTALLGITIFSDVVSRYFFNVSYAWVFELEWHFFALIFLFGAARTLGKNKHVRVDVFYSHLSKKGKSLIDAFGTLVFLIPFCAIGFWSSLKLTYNSFLINESSADPGGLPYRFLIKSAICICFFTLLIQGISLLLEKLQNIGSKG